MHRNMEMFLPVLPLEKVQKIILRNTPRTSTFIYLLYSNRIFYPYYNGYICHLKKSKSYN